MISVNSRPQASSRTAGVVCYSEKLCLEKPEKKEKKKEGKKREEGWEEGRKKERDKEKKSLLLT